MPLKSNPLGILAVVASLLFWAAGANAQITVDHPIPPTATIRVDAAQSAGTKIPRTIFGSFLEPIGNSTYNGLWAGLLQNPSHPAETFDDLSTHFVVTVSDTQMHNAPTDFITSAAFALPVELDRKLHDQQAQINQHPAFAGKAHVAFTEWLYIGHHPGTPNFTNLGGAIDAAGMLNMLMPNHSVAPISDMTGIMDFAGIWKNRGQVFASPAYWAFRMYSTAHATRPVSAQTDAGSYSVHHGVTRLPDIANVPYLDVVAALNDSGTTLSLFCINRSLNTDIPANIQVDQFPAAAAAQIQTLRSASISDINDADVPNRVIPVHTEENIRAGQLRHIFPHESVTVITFRKNS